MENLVMSDPMPNMDAFAPKFCFCGRKTVELHDFWFCSTHCARQDSLRALDDPECHYRNSTRKAYAQAGVPDLYPRRMMSVGHLRASMSQQRAFNNACPRLPTPTNPQHQGGGDQTRRGFPTLSQVAGVVLSNKAKTEEPLVSAGKNHPRVEGLCLAKKHQDHTLNQISLDAIPLAEPGPTRTLKRMPTVTDGFKANVRSSFTSLLKVGRSRKQNDERVFGHAVNTIAPPPRKDSLPSHHKKNPQPQPPVASEQKSQTLRRSASYAGWNLTPPEGLTQHQYMMQRILEQMRRLEEVEPFDENGLLFSFP